jgi:GMP synthase-like glutamine amidotransferase
MNIGILECDHVAERFRHIAGDYRDMLTVILNSQLPQFKLKYFDACNGQLPGKLDACDAYICTGSKYSAYEDVEWIHRLKDFVRRAYKDGLPFVGICFGHQVLAEALGGKTVRAPQGWGVGIHNIEIVRSEGWMQPEQMSCSLHFMHQDQVQRLPENGVLLGKSDHCPIAMFRIGETMLGIQAHPELTSAYIEALLLDRVDKIGQQKVSEAQLSLNQVTDDGILVHWIANFLKLKPAPVIASKDM